MGAAGLVAEYFAADNPTAIASRRTRLAVKKRDTKDPNTVFGNDRGVPVPEWYQEEVLEVTKAWQYRCFATCFCCCFCGYHSPCPCGCGMVMVVVVVAVVVRGVDGLVGDGISCCGLRIRRRLWPQPALSTSERARNNDTKFGFQAQFVFRCHRRAQVVVWSLA